MKNTGFELSRRHLGVMVGGAAAMTVVPALADTFKTPVRPLHAGKAACAELDQALLKATNNLAFRVAKTTLEGNATAQDFRTLSRTFVDLAADLEESGVHDYVRRVTSLEARSRLPKQVPASDIIRSTVRGALVPLEGIRDLDGRERGRDVIAKWIEVSTRSVSTSELPAEGVDLKGALLKISIAASEVAAELDKPRRLKKVNFESMICGIVGAIAGAMSAYFAAVAVGNWLTAIGIGAEIAAGCASGGALTMAICGIMGATALAAVGVYVGTDAMLSCGDVMAYLFSGGGPVGQ